MWEDLPLHVRVPESRFLLDDERLRVSYRACERAGVDPDLRILPTDWTEKRVDRFLYVHAPLIDAGNDMFADVHRQIIDRSCTFILTDSDARVLSLFSASEVIDRCASLGLRPGASLQETVSGTNGVALALRYCAPVVFKGGQHFCRLFRCWNCVAVPLVARSGDIIACIGISSDEGTMPSEKLTLTHALASLLQSMVDATCIPTAYNSNQKRRDFPQRSWRALSDRQSTILQLVAKGHMYKEIAVQLSISPRTVESHVENMRKKFKAKTTAELVAIALHHNSGVHNDASR